MSVQLTLYDGARSIGGNKFLLEAEDAVLLLDFGLNFGALGAFYDEFLGPRPTTGLLDPLELGLLPPLEGIYRPDFQLSDGRPWERLRRRAGYRRLDHLDGVLITHAHVDHTGQLSYLREDVPVYTGVTTAVVAKVMQDTSPAGAERETCYVVPREEREGLLHTGNFRQVPSRGRPFVALDPVPDAAAAFWQASPATRALEAASLRASPDGARVGGLVVRRFPVDHSIPGSCAFAVGTPAGWVVYTGDLRLHGTRGGQTRAFMEEARKLSPLALICEGTHPDQHSPVTEAQVAERAGATVRSARGLVVADFGPRNVERLLAFRQAAREADRLLAVTTRDAYLLEALHAAGEPGVGDPLEDAHLALYVKTRAQRLGWERALLDRYAERCPERVVGPREVGAAPQRFVLCFSYYDLPELIDVAPPGGTYIYSSSEAFNEEMHLDLDRLRHWLRHLGLAFAGEPPRRDGTGGDPGFHASGHIHGPGLVELVETIDPQLLIPVHTERPEFFRQHFPHRRVLFPRIGEPVRLA